LLRPSTSQDTIRFANTIVESVTNSFEQTSGLMLHDNETTSCSAIRHCPSAVGDGLRAAVGAVACAATIALMPLSALAHMSAVSDPVPCGRTCKPAAAFDPAGVLTNGGGVVQVSGPIACRAGDSVRIRATVSQLSTGVVAEGVWSKRCTGTELRWHITAIVTDGVHFSAGRAEGVGLAIIRRHGMPGSAVQWIRQLALNAA
jgi:hypothetical protein